MSDADKTKAPEKPAVDAAALAPVQFRGDIEIYPDKRLPAFDKGPAKAYAAKGRDGKALFAVLCPKSIVPRIMDTGKYVNVKSPFMANIVASGPTAWPMDKSQKYALVFENTLGKPLADIKTVGMGLKGEVVLGGVFKNIASALKDCRDNGLVHGAVRLTNIYDGGAAEGYDKAALGECLSLPHSYLQPVIYETPERAACAPIARGPSSYEDDMYAFGVTLAMLVRHADPLEGLNDEAIIQLKLELGTFGALIGKDRIVGNVLEPLRGLLNDDPRQRWTIDDVLSWMENRRVSAKPATTGKVKASRPLEFNGEKYLRPISLALDLVKNPVAAVQLVESGNLRQWLNRSVQDEVTEKRVDDYIDLTLGSVGTPVYADRLASLLSMALSPVVPMTYKGVRFMPTAFGRMLAEAYADKKDVGFFADIIQQNIVMHWVNSTELASVDIGEIVGSFETARAYLRQNLVGYGLERCLYAMVPEAPCMSERVKDYYVRNPEDLLSAYEDMANKGTRPEGFLDRHIVAFLSVRDKSSIDPYLPDLNAAEKHRYVYGVLRMLSSIQKRGNMGKMPGITNWMFEFMEPLFMRFHDRDLRVQMKENLRKLKDKGDIAKMAQVFEETNILQNDYNEFRNALKTYLMLTRESAEITYALENDKNYGAGLGRQVAAVVSGIICGILVLGTIFFKGLGGIELPWP